MRTIPNISENLKPLEQAIRHKFIFALLNSYQCNDIERQLFELPAKFGGLGIPNPSKISDEEFFNSRKITQQATNLVKTQQQKYNVDSEEIKKIKSNIKSSKKTKS